MKTHPTKLITIICEALAREPVQALLKDSGAAGYTVFPVEGSGAHGPRTGDMAEFTNVQFEVIIRPDAADALLDRLGAEFFPRFAMVAYESDIRVIRERKF